MATFGCHRCKFKPEKFKGKPFEETPCAHCPLALDYKHTFNTGFFDTGDPDRDVEDENWHDPDVRFEDEHEFVTGGKFPLKEHELQSLETIRDAIMTQVFAAFSGLMVKILRLAKQSPTMFEILIKKMQFPYMSYSEIGNSMTPRCSKQNVLYHLKSAVEMFPELECALLTDTRYSAGHYALRTIADKKRSDAATARLLEDITKGNIEDLNHLLSLPFMVRDEVFTFNAYIKDEKHVDEETGRED